MDMMAQLFVFGLYLVTGYFIGMFAERYLTSPFAMARFKNLRGGNWGVALVFFRSGQHRTQIIKLNEQSFELKETQKRYNIDSTCADRLFGIPCLAYAEDNPNPFRMSKYGETGAASPDDFQMHIRLAILQLVAQEMQTWERFKQLMLYGLLAIGLLNVLIMLLVYGQGGTLNAVGEVCYQSLNKSADVLQYIRGG